MSKLCWIIDLKGIAVLTRPASGETAEGVWQMYLVMLFLLLYILALVVLGIDGVRLVRRVFSKLL